MIKILELRDGAIKAIHRHMLRYPLLISLAAGLVSAMGFAPLGFWPVTIMALVLLIQLIRTAPNMKSALLRGWIFGVGHFSVGLNWIAHAFSFQDAMPHWLGYIAVITLSLYLAIYPAIATGLAWRWGRHHPLGFTFFFAAAWIVTEWLRATMFTGFAWNPLGVIWLGFPGMAQFFAPKIGTYGLSGVTILICGLLLYGVPRYVAGIRSSWDKTRYERVRAIAYPVLMLVCLTTLFIVAPMIDRPAPPPAGPAIRVIQPNIGQQNKYDEAFETVNFLKLVRLTGKPGPEPRLILWPEAAVSDYLEDDPLARARIAALLGPKDMLLTGGVAWILDEQGEIIGARNSLFALNPKGQITARYDKAHLVPYGEYLPMRPILSAIGLSRLVPGDVEFWPGPGPQSYALPGYGKVGVQICYEIIFSGDVIDRTNRPDFIFNPSNDAWFGTWGPPQHLAQARLRGIEEGLPVIRSTPTGISAVINARGDVLASLPMMQEGAIISKLPTDQKITLFSQYGNILPFAFAIFLVAIGVVFRRMAR